MRASTRSAIKTTSTKRWSRSRCNSRVNWRRTWRLPAAVCRPIPVFAITEFNSWWIPELKDPDYRVANALYFGGVFNELLRQSNHIFLAESCSLINVQGMVEVNPVSIKLTPPYFAYLLYANHIGTEVLKTETTVPSTTFDAKLPALDAIATRGPDGRTIFLAVVNRAQNEAVPAQINLKGWHLAGKQIQVYELEGRKLGRIESLREHRQRKHRKPRGGGEANAVFLRLSGALSDCAGA
ncbi:MAG: alpha-L-arabinofuranosidase C-terminal domain-containing protein [Terriglobales bacterium]